jgi:hypothetical protein
MDIAIINLTDEETAKSVLKAELARRDISYQRLAELMVAKGWKLTKASIDNKMSRGSFSADFFLDSLKVIGCERIGIARSNPT